MYSVQMVIKEGDKNIIVETSQTPHKSVAETRVMRFGGYAIELATKKLVAQSLVPAGPKFVGRKQFIGSGEDAECEC